jgi:hypothetical protein
MADALDELNRPVKLRFENHRNGLKEELVAALAAAIGSGAMLWVTLAGVTSAGVGSAPPRRRKG